MEYLPDHAPANATDDVVLPHHQALEVSASEALSSGAFRKAYALADRRCRIRPAPEAHAFVLRAEAAHKLGDRQLALADLDHAIAISPDNVSANRRLLAWGNAVQQRRAAAALVSLDTDTPSLQRAIGTLRKHGKRSFASVTILDDAIRGWVAWYGDDKVEISIASDRQTVSVVLDADPFHALANRTLRATGFRLPRPGCSEPQAVFLSDEGGVFFSTRAAANQAAPKSPKVTAPDVGPRGVTVIVPVFADYPATKRCLDILVHELDGHPQHRAVIVNDAAPDPRMARYLARISKHRGVTILSNEWNLGFVGSINRGLELAEGGDVLLLNADTIPPSRIIERLMTAAGSSPDIGLVVPLSNNAELTSFPVPNVANPLSSADEAARFDEIAERENAGKIIDIPAGTGFCLYVTRACLNAVGGLLETFHRGYLEDAELCLRARTRGFRTVCDPSIYVGHLGARSFGAEKSSLVVRNFRILEQRFPNYASESIAYSEVDQLRSARAAIERAALLGQEPMRLLVTRRGAMAEVAADRARQIATIGERAIIAEISFADGVRLSLRAADGALPQSMAFNLEALDSSGELCAAFKSLPLSGVEILDPANVPEGLLAALIETGVAIDQLITGTNPFPARAVEARRWRQVADIARRILAPTEDAREFASRRLSPRNAAKLELLQRQVSASRARQKGPGVSLGIMPVWRSTGELRLIQQIVDAFRVIVPQPSLVVLGETMDDARVMQGGTAFVTGAIDPFDLPLMRKCHGLRSLFAGFGQALFGHPMTEAARHSALPVAYCDWTTGRSPRREGDLPLDPSLSGAQIAAALIRWVGCA